MICESGTLIYLRYLRSIFDPECDYLDDEFRTLFLKKKEKKPLAQKKDTHEVYKPLREAPSLRGQLSPPDFYDRVAAKIDWERQRVVKWFDNKRNMSAQNRKNQKKN